MKSTSVCGETRTLTKTIWLAAAVTLISFGAFSAEASPATPNCEELATLRLPRITITSATVLTAEAVSAITPTGEKALGEAHRGRPICRVIGISRPTPQSRIGFQVWLPLAHWNGKYHGVGNGGLGGYVFESLLALAAEEGWVAAGTDDGHQGDGLEWLDEPESIVDWAYRAVHETAVAAKAIINSFYGRQAQYSYFSGCSKGGQEALMLAQRFPLDYDGIVSGSPAGLGKHSYAPGFIWRAGLIGRIPQNKLIALNKAVVAACDAEDGVIDGLVGNPLACRIDPARLQCQTDKTSDCLTPDQAEAARAIYTGRHDPHTGEVIDYDLAAGSETPTLEQYYWERGWSSYLSAEVLHHAYALIGRGVFRRPDWNWTEFDFDRDQKRSTQDWFRC